MILDIFLGDIVAILCVIPTICFALGSFWFLKAFIEDITMDLAYLKAKKTQRHDERELKTDFCQMVRMYTDLKELRPNFSHFHF